MDTNTNSKCPIVTVVASVNVLGSLRDMQEHMSYYSDVQQWDAWSSEGKRLTCQKDSIVFPPGACTVM